MVYISGKDCVLNDIMIEKKWKIRKVKQEIKWDKGIKRVIVRLELQDHLDRWNQMTKDSKYENGVYCDLVLDSNGREISGTKSK